MFVKKVVLLWLRWKTVLYKGAWRMAL